MTKQFYYHCKRFTLTSGGSGEIFVQVEYDMRNSVHFKKMLHFHSKNTLAFDYCDADAIPAGEYFKNCNQARKEFENEFMCYRDSRDAGYRI